MADQGKWFKLWCSALDDNDMENLTIHEWFCWIRLGTYIKRHGCDGKVVFTAPARALLNMFRVPDFTSAIDIIKRFPNCKLGERNSTVTGETYSTVTVDIEYLNWFKYQGDFSNDRVRRFRDKQRHDVTAQEEKRSRRDVEEKREQHPIAPTGAPLGGECEYCGATEADTGFAHEMDHFIPRSKGGSDCEANLVKACHVCNQAKQGRLFETIAEARAWLHNAYWNSARARWMTHRKFAFGGSPPAEIVPYRSGAESVPFAEFKKIWNGSCGPLPKTEILTDKRKAKLRLRWAEKPDLSYWQSVIERISRSNFCRGDSNSGWRASFDWLIANDTNHVKVIEGKYDNREGPNGTNDRAGAVDYAALARAKRATEKVRTISPPRAIPGRSGDLSDAETKAESRV